jgi:hypothetical protein
MLFLKILAFILLVSGAFTVFAAGIIVKRFNIEKMIKGNNGYNEENKQSEEYGNIERYRFEKAVLNLKLFGMLLILPGLIIIILVF